MKKLIFAALMLLTQPAVYAQLPADPCDFGSGTPLVAPRAERVREFIHAKCSQCHGLGATLGAGVFTNIEDWDEFVKKIVPGDPDKSQAWQAVGVRKTMPKIGKAEPSEIKDFYDWIKEDKAESWENVISPLPVEYISPIQVRACVLKHAREADRIKRNDAKNYRYALFVNVHNTGSRDDFDNQVDAVNLALSSINFDFGKRLASSTTYKAETTNPADKGSYNYTPNLDITGTIRAIYTPSILKEVKDFDNLVLKNDIYRIDYTKGNVYDRTTIDEIKRLEDELEDLTGDRQPFFDGGFFTREVLLNRYYEALGIDAKRDNLKDIEHAINVDTKKAIEDQEVHRMVISRSGVSLNARVADSFEANYSFGGSFYRTRYYLTYDFLNEVDKRDPFVNPFGPVGVNFDFDGDGKNDTDKIFEHDAGEAFFLKPDGMPLWIVADKNGKLLAEADTKVAFNPHRVHPVFSPLGNPGAVVTGGGCFECHTTGTNYALDEGRDFFRLLPALSSTEFNFLDLIYPQQKVWDTDFKSYNASFQTSHQVIAPNPKTLTTAGEPVTLALQTFQNYQSRKSAAAQVGLSEEAFDICLAHEPAIAAKLRTKGGSISRESLDDQFDEIVAACGVGKVVRFKGVVKPPIKPPPGKRCDYGFKNGSPYRLEFIANWDDGSANSVALFPAENKSFNFLIGRDVEGSLSDFSYAVKGASGYGSRIPMSGTHKINGCHDYEFFDDKGHPNIR
jgi:mono/diheme cytochrome c family protein